MENTSVLLVVLTFDTNDKEHLLYRMPSDQIETARNAVHTGWEHWQNGGRSDPAFYANTTLEACIENAMKSAGVECEQIPLETEEINLDE